MDRFALPGPSDEIVTCVDCDVPVHYEKLDDNGRCPSCRNAFEEEEDD